MLGVLCAAEMDFFVAVLCGPPPPPAGPSPSLGVTPTAPVPMFAVSPATAAVVAAVAAGPVADVVEVTASTAAAVLAIYHQLILLRSPHLLLLYHLLLLLTFPIHHPAFASFILHLDNNTYIFLYLFCPILEARAVTGFSSCRKANPLYELSDYTNVMGKSVLGAGFSRGPSHGGGLGCVEAAEKKSPVLIMKYCNIGSSRTSKYINTTTQVCQD